MIVVLSRDQCSVVLNIYSPFACLFVFDVNFIVLLV